MSSDKPPSAERRADAICAATWFGEVPWRVAVREIRSAEQARDDWWRGKLAELEQGWRDDKQIFGTAGIAASVKRELADELAALRKESGE